MKTTLLHAGRAAACLVLAGALLTSCSLLPAASPLPDLAPAEDTTLYDTTRLEDGRLRILYSADGSTVLCGGKVLHEGRADESISLVYDPQEIEIPYYWVAWSDNTSASGRRSALYDTTGAAVQTFDRDYSVSLCGTLLVLNRAENIEFSGDPSVQPGDCRVLDLATGQEFPVPDNAYQCAATGDLLAFTCYDRPDSLSSDEYDEALYQHTRMVLQDKAGNVLREEDRCTAWNFASGDSSISTDWLLLNYYGEDDPYASMDAVLYNTATGEELYGLSQACGNGTASFQTDDGHYQLVDLASTEQSQVLSTFDSSVSYYLPGAAVTWNSSDASRNFRYQFHDLETGEVKDVFNLDVSDTQMAVYTTDGMLRVYDRTTGAILTDLTVEPLEDQDTAQIWTVGDDYVLLMLYPAGDRTPPTIRIYNAQGLVRELDNSTTSVDGYTYFSPLTTVDGHAYFRYGYDGPNNTTLYDVLDENGNTVLKGLSTCYSYYSTGANSLPAGAFVARKGFYYGWMAPDGQWLYCHSIFSSPTDEGGLGYLL